jgi:hypothetical protein
MTLPLINEITGTNRISFLGWKTNNLNYSPESVGFGTGLPNWLNNFFGQTVMTSVGALTFPTSFESLPLPVTNTNHRFNDYQLSTTNSNQSGQFMRNYGVAQLSTHPWTNQGRIFWGVLSDTNLSIFSINKNGENMDNSGYFFSSIGWLSNPLYSGSAFPRNAYFLFLSRHSNQIGGGRPSTENGLLQYFQIPTETSADSIANYPIACQAATPGANTTKLYLRGNISPHKAIGYVPHLLKTNLQIPVGQIYRNTGIDPDGISMHTWICVGVFGSERILMRAWTQGLG